MEKYLDAAVKSISQSIRFDSSRGERTGNMPFGKGAYDCLQHFLSLAQTMGFETHDYDGYAGEVVFGEGEEFGILCHLDVVPAGSGWTKDPFGGVVEEGRIWGRGAVDDKGPAICCLYALKALKDEGFTPEKKIKLIVGCNEESGWACIDHYNEVAHMPEIGFSPDADFPVIYAEKGILHLRLHFPLNGKAPFLRLEGGEIPNMVCDFCTTTPRSINRKRAAACGLSIEDNRLVARGKCAHGSTPERGVNAIEPVLRYFKDKLPAAARALECLFDDVYGLKKLHDETGNLTISPNVIRFRRGELQILCDIRYPATFALADVFKEIDCFGVKYETLQYQAPLFADKKSALVQTLLGVYEECTGKKAQPIAIGGGTYARALKQGVAFGPECEGDEPVIHRADEYITVERVKLLLEIYKKAIEKLTK